MKRGSIFGVHLGTGDEWVTTLESSLSDPWDLSSNEPNKKLNRITGFAFKCIEAYGIHIQACSMKKLVKPMEFAFDCVQ
jgi:hypothetical protein